MHNLENSFKNITWSELGNQRGIPFCFLVKKEAIRLDSDEKAILYGKEVHSTTYCTCLSEYLMPSSSCLQCGKDEAGRMEPQGKGVPTTRKK